MIIAKLTLATLFCWVIGLLYFRQVRHFIRSRTDRVEFTLFPFSKTVQFEQDGAAHWLMRALHFVSSALYVVVGVPSTLFFMILMPFMLFKQLAQG